MSTALHQLAWISATAPQAELRDGRQAVALAERLRTVAGRKDPEVLDVLAAAYAEVGRFTEAVATAREAAALARSLGRNDQSDDIEKRLNLYGAGRPYRQIR